ncbi:unnamed protein product, partial [Prorocentrum cordatum]
PATLANDTECKDAPDIKSGLPIVYPAALSQHGVATMISNDVDRKAMPSISIGLPIVSDSNCPGLSYPCRHNSTGYHSAVLAQQKVTNTPSNDGERKAMPNIKTGLLVVYDSTCPCPCCFESYPCMHITT